jgi:hypothetical protein
MPRFGHYLAPLPDYCAICMIARNANTIYNIYNILARSPKSKTKKMVQNRRRVYRLLARKKAISEPYRLLSEIEN